MANQYNGSFADKINKKYGVNVIDALNDFVKKDYSYADIAALVKVKETTVRKWCNRYRVQLKYNEIKGSKTKINKKPK
jgi:transposase